MKITQPKLTDNALEIVKKRYLRTDMNGEVVENVGEMFWRVAKHIAKAEMNWGDVDAVNQVAETFFKRMVDLKLVVAGKAMFEAGNSGGTGQLSSCFVLPIVDDMKAIFKTLGDAALIHKNNGGTGFNFSAIRPRKDKVRNVPQSASGPVDFLGAFSAALSKILQGSKRQGANIGVLNCDHPDILDFINLKTDDGTIKNFNISVGVTDEFLQTVERDGIWELKNPRNGEVVKTLPARELFDAIISKAWSTGDPGLAFLDRMEQDNPTPILGKINCTNPCGEIPLLPYESCNLTSIVLSNHLIKVSENVYEIDWEDLRESVKVGIRLLDNMIEVNTYVLPEIEQTVKYGNRRIGLGVMGFAHMLYKLNIPYDSEDAVRLSERLSKFIRNASEEMSLELGKKRGVFPNWDRSIYAGSAETYRNCALTMIAPTGTISMVANCSSGIEPVFSLVTKRRTFFEGNKANRPTRELVMIDPVFLEKLESKIGNKARVDEIIGQIANTNSFDGIGEIDEDMKKIFTTAHHIEPKWHVRIQAAWQKHIDNSVSKTVNFPTEATVDDVKEVYLMAWRLGCKGITIYRDGSKQDQVLNVGKTNKPTLALPYQGGDKKILKEGDLNVETQDLASLPCPECGARVETEICYSCGWTKNL